MSSIDNNSISIRDNDSQILDILPKEWWNLFSLYAKIQGYDGIDDYVLHLIKDRLEMFTDTRDGLDEDFQTYMCEIMKIPFVKEESRTSDDEKISKFVKKVHNEYNNKLQESDEKKKKENEDLK